MSVVFEPAHICDSRVLRVRTVTRSCPLSSNQHTSVILECSVFEPSLVELFCRRSWFFIGVRPVVAPGRPVQLGRSILFQCSRFVEVWAKGSTRCPSSQRFVRCDSCGRLLAGGLLIGCRKQSANTRLASIAPHDLVFGGHAAVCRSYRPADRCTAEGGWWWSGFWIAAAAPGSAAGIVASGTGGGDRRVALTRRVCTSPNI
jgi:hypothetical protein